MTTCLVEWKKRYANVRKTHFEIFVKVYPPVVPAAKDHRHIQALSKVLASWVDRGLSWGRTVIPCSSSTDGLRR